MKNQSTFKIWNIQFPEFAKMEIIDGSFAYAMPAGSCKKEAWEGHYQYIEVLVYATDGVVVGWRYGPLE